MAPNSTDLAPMDVKNDVKHVSLLHSKDESDELSDVEDSKDWKDDDNADDSYVEDVKVTPSKKRKQGTARAESKVKSQSAPSTPTKGGKRAAKSQDSPKKGPSKFWTPEEEAALWKGIGCVALNDVSGVKAFSGLADRNPAQLNMKIRGELKKRDKDLGGTGDWVAEFVVKKVTEK
ncbi:unnamed protein product [Jaminaea pallidilutea]